MSAKTQVYLGAPTPFGTIIKVEPHLYNPVVTVRDRHGSESVRQLGHLQALGVRPITTEAPR